MGQGRGTLLRKLLAYLPALVTAAAILVVGSLRRVPHPPSGLPLDKLAHFAMYGVLGTVAALCWRRADRTPTAFAVALCAILVGAADELHQRSVPGRSAELADWAADIAGVAVGFSLVARRDLTNRNGMG